MSNVHFITVGPEGRILASGVTQEKALALMPGARVAPPGISGATHYVAGDQIIAFPRRPSPAHVFDFRARLWVPDFTSAWARVRAERDQRLQACDWTQQPDVPMTPERRAAWASYRQALRDITGQADPFAITWPAAPSN